MRGGAAGSGQAAGAGSSTADDAASAVTSSGSTAETAATGRTPLRLLRLDEACLLDFDLTRIGAARLPEHLASQDIESLPGPLVLQV